MARLAVEATASVAAVPVASYDSTKWNYPSLVRKRTDLTPAMIGPITPAVFRPVEQSAAIPGIYPHVVPWSTNIDWIFLADNASAAVTRRFQAYTFNKATGAVTWKGFITVNSTGTGNITVRDLRVSYEKYITGTAAVSGTAVTGTSTLWQTNRQCAGCRIGFGSTDPTQITTWYEIASIGGEGSITLTGSAGTIADGAYVIEDLRLIHVVTNVTTTNGGVWLVKGISIDTFTSGGTTINLASTTDNVRANYWLADAATVTNITAAGCGLDTKTDWTNQDLYVLDLVSAGNYKVYKYNVRKALTLTGGKDTTCLLLATGNNAFTGTGSQTSNCLLGTLNHGPHSGVKCLYFVSTTRIMGAPVTGIVAASTTWITSTMTEVPPGGTTTIGATGAMTACDVADSIDRLIVQTSNATAFRAWVTQFRTDAGQMEAVFGVDDRLIQQAGADANVTPHFSTLSVAHSMWTEGGMLYTFGTGTTAATNIGFAIPIGADWAYASASGQRLISPALSTPNAVKYYRAGVVRDRMIGGDVLGCVAQPFKLYQRTTGISDNSGSWTLVADGNDLSSIDGAASIQFMFEFRIISDTMVPARIFSVSIQYEDNTTDSHWQLSVAQSNITTKKFAWRFSTAYGSTVPRLKVTLYDAVAGTNLGSDDSTTQAWTWEKSTNGGSSYGAYDTTDKGNETTYIRVTPSSLADNINVVPLLTLY